MGQAFMLPACKTRSRRGKCHVMSSKSQRLRSRCPTVQTSIATLISVSPTYIATEHFH